MPDSDLTAQVLAVNNAVMQTGNSDKKLCGWRGGGESKLREFLRVCLSLLKQKRGQLLPMRDDATVPLICGIQHSIL